MDSVTTGTGWVYDEDQSISPAVREALLPEGGYSIVRPRYEDDLTAREEAAREWKRQLREHALPGGLFAAKRAAQFYGDAKLVEELNDHIDRLASRRLRAWCRGNAEGARKLTDELNGHHLDILEWRHH